MVRGHEVFSALDTWSFAFDGCSTAYSKIANNFLCNFLVLLVARLLLRTHCFILPADSWQQGDHFVRSLYLRIAWYLSRFSSFPSLIPVFCTEAVVSSTASAVLLTSGRVLLQGRWRADYGTGHRHARQFCFRRRMFESFGRIRFAWVGGLVEIAFVLVCGCSRHCSWHLLTPVVEPAWDGIGTRLAQLWNLLQIICILFDLTWSACQLPVINLWCSQ